MATCSRCGNANVTGKFCGTCGAPVSEQAAGAMPSPPPPPAGPQGWQPTQAPPPVPNQPQQAWQQPMPPRVPNQPQPPQQNWQQPGPGYGPAPVPPKKGGAGKVVGIIAGVFVGLIVLLFVVVALLPDDPAVDPVTPPPTADKTNQPANPPANQPANTTTTNQQPAAAKAYPAKTLAQGTFDFTNPTSYDGFGGFQVAFGRNNGDQVESAVYEFTDGQLRKAVESVFPHGKLNDINHGQIFNDGNDLAIISAANGITLIDEVGNTDPLDGRTAEHMLIGDYDGDGNAETLVVLKQADGYSFEIWRYTKGGQGTQSDKLKSMVNFKFLGSPQVVKLAGDNRSLVLGLAPEQAADGLGFQALHVNSDSGTFDQYGLWTVPESNDAVVVGYTATTINGKDTLLVSYAGAQPHIELFDISKKGAYAPASLGTIKLPEGAGRGLILGKFTQNKNPEIFTFTTDGQFAIYGF